MDTESPPVASATFVYEALPGRVVFGPGKARSLADEVARLEAERVLLVATEHEAPLARELAAPLGQRWVASFTEAQQHVPVAVAEAARAAAADHQADLVLSVGRGSTTGTAKAIALTTGLPILAVPTTYAGSEATPVWGLTDGQRKTTGTDRRVLPTTVVYDPELTVSLPSDLTAVSGLNALAHCVEAFWGAGANPASAALAERGIRALADGLPGAVADGTDLAARADALIGAWLAGAAFATAGGGLHHKICHVLGGAYDLPHAATHAIVLPHVLAFNAPAAPEAATRIAAALGHDDAVAGLVALGARVGAPTALRDVGLSQAQLDEAADLAAAKVPAANPRPVSREDVAALLSAAWQGPPMEVDEAARSAAGTEGGG